MRFAGKPNIDKPHSPAWKMKHSATSVSPASTGYITIVLRLNFKAFLALVPMHTTHIHISSATLHPATELNTLKRPSRSRMNCVTRLSAVIGRFITISIIRKM